MVRLINYILIAALLATILPASASAQSETEVTIARLKYPGGGDWYWGSSALPNLIDFVRDNSNVRIAANEARIGLSDQGLFNYPFLFMTGHGNVNFRADDLDILRRYLRAGGFLFANDSYGMRNSFFREMKKLFPD
ncbi:MAG: DUF4159 domain-containing protein, partial [bacterium]